jgi:glucose/arabinose dehydrogenase
MKALFLLPAALAFGGAGSVLFHHGPVLPRPAAVAAHTPGQRPGELRTGPDAFGDWSTDAPGVRRRITVPDLPAPHATPSVDHGADMVPRPDGVFPQAPRGFKVELFAHDLSNPRKIVTAPNGDLFVAESGANRVKILRAPDGAGAAQTTSVYAEGLRQPFGIAFYPSGPSPQWVYVANTDSVVRFPYHNGDLKAAGDAQDVVPTGIPGGGRLRGGGHWTRDLAFSPDGKTMLVSVGSHSNNDDPDTHPVEFHRADILRYTPEGAFEGVYASGIRNPVGIAFQPGTDSLWTSVNERDTLGDNLVPDYVTRVTPNAFYGWPWYYMGDHHDPRYPDSHPELAGHVTVPGVLLQPHMASLCLTFYPATGPSAAFPAKYRGMVFAAEHGSWNRARRTGYKVILVPVINGKAAGEYDDFLTGFVTSEGAVWGRPVGVTVAHDGSLMVTDDGSNSVWRVSYVGK